MTLGVKINEPMEEKINEFKNDPQKMEVTTKFVNDVVEKAKNEALKRMNEKQKVDDSNSVHGTGRKRRRWQSRARGFFSRLLSSFCLCNTETKV